MDYKCYFGDIHNHCDTSYAHGSLENALNNAMLQLDFVSVTGHSSWPDIPDRKAPLESLVDYHVNGFNKLQTGWERFVDTFDRFNDPGSFVCFPSYEIHSMADGDHTVYFKDHKRPMFKPDSIPDFQDIVRDIRIEGDDAFLTPHHIGYRTGYRGINWDSYSEKASPFVEIISMHGCSESDDSALPYLHTMGPRNGSNTMQAGLSRGFHFGVIGSTDHHSAHPGSHGYGKVAIWAEELTKDAIWSALKKRRCYALTGDKIVLDFSLNNANMGEIIPYSEKRDIHIDVRGGDALDYMELLRNNIVIRRWNYLEDSNSDITGPVKGKVFIEAGWGVTGERIEWDILISLNRGKILDVEPRLHGIDVVDPEQKHTQEYQFSNWSREGDAVRLRTCTWGNPTTLTNTNQGLCLEIEAESDAELCLDVNNVKYRRNLKDLSVQSDSFYLGRFLSGAVHIHRFVPERMYNRKEYLSEIENGDKEDSYYVRVRQKNGQWAYSSPIWVRSKV